MPEHLPSGSSSIDPQDQEKLRLISRSPHPYHHQSFELPHPADHLLRKPPFAQCPPDRADRHLAPPTLRPTLSKESSAGSDSGTEADDEHFLKGLPAPRGMLHKGLRGIDEHLSGTSTPLLPSASPEEQGRNQGEKLKSALIAARIRKNIEQSRRRKTAVRRSVEVAIVVCVILLVLANGPVQELAFHWLQELSFAAALLTSLLVLYALRVAMWSYWHGASSTSLPLRLPTDFDPAPVLYPPAVTLVTSLLIAAGNEPAVALPNISLTICTLPTELIPVSWAHESYNALHWLLACLPLARTLRQSSHVTSGWTAESRDSLAPEVAVLLFPLHRSLCETLQHLTTTSLLPTELQLLSVALINLLLLSFSPQMRILKDILWVGGLSILIVCGQVIINGITLARVPRWRFRPDPIHPMRQSSFAALKDSTPLRRLRQGIAGIPLHTSDLPQSEELDLAAERTKQYAAKPTRGNTVVFESAGHGAVDVNVVPSTRVEAGDDVEVTVDRRHTFPQLNGDTHLPPPRRSSGRRKRTPSLSIRPFLRLTYEQAKRRKWLYAGYVYICILLIVIIGIREFISLDALAGNEPIGWALGYLFGDLHRFRFFVVRANLERWICLPARPESGERAFCDLGWVQRIRYADFGEANMRLLLGAHFLLILVFGLVVVYRLKDIYEVDTRRKVFHFMMVGMLLPATYIDPTYCALALSIVLAVFLVLDLLRTSQLPPLSKPLASFLAPYVDGRDCKGPVVISHIFLLIGCAVPLWLTLASLPRVDSGYLAGWEVPTREVSMVSGVVCVGLGDAAASLIGRRFGRRKWYWGGGKSLEGSLAFAVAVFVGLVLATAWLRIGGWPATAGHVPWATSIRTSAVCGSMASLTEAVLTGGNDNVIVPVVLWACVKSLGA